MLLNACGPLNKGPQYRLRMLVSAGGLLERGIRARQLTLVSLSGLPDRDLPDPLSRPGNACGLLENPPHTL
jgi:hypothetical protein